MPNLLTMRFTISSLHKINLTFAASLSLGAVAKRRVRVPIIQSIYGFAELDAGILNGYV